MDTSRMSAKKILPLPLREGVGGGVWRRQAHENRPLRIRRRTTGNFILIGPPDWLAPNPIVQCGGAIGFSARFRAQTPPPTPSRKGRGSFLFSSLRNVFVR